MNHSIVWTGLMKIILIISWLWFKYIHEDVKINNIKVLKYLLKEFLKLYKLLLNIKNKILLYEEKLII